MLPSGGELLIVVFVVFLLFGGRELPKIARTMGKWTAMMKRSLNDVRREFNRISIEEELKESTKSIRDLKDDPLGLKNLATPEELKRESKQPEPVANEKQESGGESVEPVRPGDKSFLGSDSGSGNTGVTG